MVLVLIKLPKLWNNGRLDDKTECIEWVMETPKKGQTFPAVRRCSVDLKIM